MEQVRATRSVSITELKRSAKAVLDQAGSEPVAVLITTGLPITYFPQLSTRHCLNA